MLPPVTFVLARCHRCSFKFGCVDFLSSKHTLTFSVGLCAFVISVDALKAFVTLDGSHITAAVSLLN